MPKALALALITILSYRSCRGFGDGAMVQTDGFVCSPDLDDKFKRRRAIKETEK